MTFDWKEFLKVAKFLRNYKEGDITEEAVLRCAVSRAYYAVFCYTRNFARDNLGFIPTHEAKDHTLLRRFLRSKNKTAVASFLDDLRKWRNNCDYDDNVDNINILADSALKKALTAFEKVK